MNEYFVRLYCRACDADNAKVWKNHAMYGGLETVYVVKFSDVGALVEWGARSYDSK